MNNLITVISVFGLLFLITACGEKQVDSGEDLLLARVQSEYLTLQEAREQIPDFIYRQDSSKALQRYRKQWINQKLLLLKAEALQLDQQKQVQIRLKNARQEVLTTALQEILIARFDSTIVITDPEALRYYDNYKEQFLLDERYVRFRHVTTNERQFARAARQEIQSGTAWPEVARLYSAQPAKRIQQSEKFWPQSIALTELPAMERYIATIDSGEISPIQRFGGAYHFIQLTGARAAGEYAKPAWVMDRLKKWILLQKQQQYYNSYLKNLYLDAKSDNEVELYNVTNTNNYNTKPDTIN